MLTEIFGLPLIKVSERCWDAEWLRRGKEIINGLNRETCGVAWVPNYRSFPFQVLVAPRGQVPYETANTLNVKYTPEFSTTLKGLKLRQGYMFLKQCRFILIYSFPLFCSH
jgi:hypothetical protein